MDDHTNTLVTWTDFWFLLFHVVFLFLLFNLDCNDSYMYIRERHIILIINIIQEYKFWCMRNSNNWPTVTDIKILRNLQRPNSCFIILCTTAKHLTLYSPECKTYFPTEQIPLLLFPHTVDKSPTENNQDTVIRWITHISNSHS